MKMQIGHFSETTRGMLWMLLTGFCFLGVTVVVRYIGPRVPAGEAAFIRYIFGTLMLLPVFVRIFSGAIKVYAWRTLTIRGVCHGFGVILWFYAMARIPIADVTALGYLTPVLVTLGAAIFFKETLHLRRIAAVVFGLIGVMIILRPGYIAISAGQVAQLVATPLFAISILMTKQLTTKESHSVIVAILSLVCTITLFPIALTQWITPTPSELLLLALTAVFATLGHYTMTRAISLAPLAVLQPVGFLQLLWATLMGAWLFSETIDLYVIAGGAILVLSTTYIAHRESVANRVST